MRRNKLYGETFYGNEASEYAKEQGYLDYATLAKAFDAVLNNDIIAKTQEVGYWEEINGMIDNSEEIEKLKEQIEDLEEDTEEYKDIQEQIEKLEEEQEQSYNQDIFQYYIVSDRGAEIIQEYTNDPLFYNEELDMYIWGVTHYGTSWKYVLTNVKLNCGEEAFN